MDGNGQAGKDMNTEKQATFWQREKHGAKRLLVRVVWFTCLAISFAVGSVVVTTCLGSSDNSDGFLMGVSKELSKSLPQVIDKYTRWDSAVAILPKTLLYKYTLIGVDAADLDVSKLKTEATPHLVQNYKTHPMMQSWRKRGIILKYEYYDDKGIFVMEITVLPDLP